MTQTREEQWKWMHDKFGGGDEMMLDADALYTALKPSAPDEGLRDALIQCANHAVNFIIENIQKEFGLGLTGQLLANGEEAGDVWILAIGDDGFAHVREVPQLGQKIKCPHCDEHFILDAKEPTHAE